MADRKKKTYGMVVSEQEKNAIAAFVKKEIGVQGFKELTGTNNSSAYSTIARGVRQLFQEGKLKIKI